MTDCMTDLAWYTYQVHSLRFSSPLPNLETVTERGIRTKSREVFRGEAAASVTMAVGESRHVRGWCGRAGRWLPDTHQTCEWSLSPDSRRCQMR